MPKPSPWPQQNELAAVPTVLEDHLGASDGAQCGSLSETGSCQCGAGNTCASQSALATLPLPRIFPDTGQVFLQWEFRYGCSSVHIVPTAPSVLSKDLGNREETQKPLMWLISFSDPNTRSIHPICYIRAPNIQPHTPHINNLSCTISGTTELIKMQWPIPQRSVEFAVSTQHCAACWGWRHDRSLAI